MTKSEYEKINLNQDMPAFIWYFGRENYYINEHLYIPPHWHRSIEMTLVIDGEVNI